MWFISNISLYSFVRILGLIPRNLTGVSPDFCILLSFHSFPEPLSPTPIPTDYNRTLHLIKTLDTVTPRFSYITSFLPFNKELDLVKHKAGPRVESLASMCFRRYVPAALWSFVGGKFLVNG